MTKTKNLNKDGYFKKMLKHGYLIVSILIATLAMTMLVALVNFKVIDAIESVKNLTLYLGISIGVVLLYVLIYMLGKIRCERLSLADSIGFAVMLIGIGIVLYFALYIRTFTQTGITRIVIGAVIFVLGLAYLFFRLAFFKKHERRKIVYIKNSLTGYFSLIGQKYSFVSVLITGIVAVSLLHLAFTPSIANRIVVSLMYNTPFLIIMGLTGLAFILYLTIEVSSKHVSPVDLLLSSGIVFFPIAVVNCLLLKESYIRPLIVVATIFALYLVLLIVRVNCFDITVPEKHDKKHFSDILLTITVSMLIVGGATLIIQTNLPGAFMSVGAMDSIHCISFAPASILLGAVGIATLFNFVISIANINAKTLNGVDTLSDISFTSSVLAFGIIAIYPALTLILIVSAFFIMNLAVFIARRRVLSAKK